MIESWFTVEKLDPQTFVISEYKHWEETHCYLLCGRERALLIDSGLGVSNVRGVVDRLTSLPVLVALTHAHWDHFGGLRHFECFALHEAEKDWIAGQFPLPLDVVKNSLTKIPCDFPEGFNIDDYQIFRGMPRSVLHDGDRLDLGGREIRVIHTPGHSPGHCCFYEPERGYLYSGDLIYKGCLCAFYPATDPRQFYQSVRKLRNFEISRILPGHHSLDIPVSLIWRIEEGFARIKEWGMLAQGNGTFDFDDFQIQI